MKRGKRRQHTAAFKAEVALAACRGDRTLSELAQAFKIHPNLIRAWKESLLEGASSLFERPGKAAEDRVDTDALYKKIGQLEVERDFLASRPALQALLGRGGK
jgi:transposase